MAIQVNGFEPQALASLAGNVTPNYNLQTHSITGGDFFKELANQNNTSRQQDIAQQGADANTLRANNEMPIAQMQEQGQNQRADAQNAIERERINIYQQAATTAALKAHVEELKQQNMDKLKSQYGAATSLYSVISSIKNDSNLNPAQKEEQLNKAKQVTADTLFTQGSISKEEHDHILNTPNSQLETETMVHVGTLQAAIQGKTNAAAAIDKANKSTVGVSPSDTSKRVAETNAARIAAGQPPLTPDEIVKYNQQGLITSVSPNRGQINPYDKAAADAGQANMTEIDKRSAARDNFDKQISDAIDSVKGTPKLFMGPFGQYYASLNPDAQKAIGNLNNIVLTYKNIQNMGSQGFTDADREFIAKVSGGMGSYKGTTQELLEGMQALSRHGARYDWLQQNEFNKKTSDYNNWLQAHPEPTVIVQTPDNQSLQVPVSRVNELRRDHPKVKVID